MKTLRLYIVLIYTSISILSCDKEEESVKLTNEYLPLEVGNYWQLEYLEEKKIIGAKTIDSKEYHLLLYQNDTSYYRIENDQVFVSEFENSTALKFNLSAEVNEEWNYNSYIVKLISKSESITINHQEISDCYQFYFDIPEMADDEHTIWLAPNIGFIQEQCGECLHQIKKLDKVSIDGKVIDF